MSNPDFPIPREAVKAAASAYTAAIYRGYGTTKEFNAAIEAALHAGLKAWPNGGLHVPVPAGAPRKSFTLPAMILPVSLENTNAET